MDVDKLIEFLTQYKGGVCAFCGGQGMIWDPAAGYATMKPCPQCGNGTFCHPKWEALADLLYNAEVPK